MASLEEIRALGNDFLQNIQRLQTARAISDANDQVMQINEQVTDEAQKRQGLTQTSNQLTQRLAQLGTPATTIQQVAGSMMPKSFSSVQEAFLSGDSYGQTQASRYLGAQAASERSVKIADRKAAGTEASLLAGEKFGYEQRLQGQKDAAALEREKVKTGEFGTLKPVDKKLKRLTGDQRTKLGFLVGAMADVNSMENELINKGTNTKSLIGENPFTLSKSQFVNNVGRFDSGGQISGDEMNQYGGWAPDTTDAKKGMAKFKFKQMRKQVLTRAKAFGIDAADIEELLKEIPGANPAKDKAPETINVDEKTGLSKSLAF